jgi:hypothetical protein
MKILHYLNIGAIIAGTSMFTASAQGIPEVTFLDPTPANGAGFLDDRVTLKVLFEDDQNMGFQDNTMKLDFSFPGQGEHGISLFGSPRFLNEDGTAMEMTFFLTIPIHDQPLHFWVWFEDTDGNATEQIVYFDTFDPENPVVEAEWHTNTDAPVEVVNSTDAPREWEPQERAVTGLDAGEFLDYELSLPAGNYHVFLKQNLEGRERSTISLHQLLGEESNELGVFQGETTPGFYRNFPLMNRAGKRMQVVSAAEVIRFRLQAEDELADGESLALNYLVWIPTDELPQRWALQSAPQADGPYVDDPMADVDSELGEIQTEAQGEARFYRLRSLQEGDTAPRIESIERNGGEVFLKVED